MEQSSGNQASFISFAKEQGFDFSVEEMNAVTDEQAENGIFLNDEELDKAVGGMEYDEGDYDEYGRRMLSFSFCCEYWYGGNSWNWITTKKQCSYCKHWKPNESLCPYMVEHNLSWKK